MPIYELRLYRKVAEEHLFDLIDKVTFGAIDDGEARDTAPKVEPEAFDAADFAFLWSGDGKDFWTLKPDDAASRL